MLKAIAAATLLSLAGFGTALAQNCPAYPYNLANGATADATQVMANFNCAALTSSPAFSGSVSVGGKLGVGTTTPNSSTTLDVRTPSTAGVPVALFGYGQAGVALEQNWPGFYLNNYYINGSNYFMGSGYAGLLNLNAQTGDFYIQTSSAAGSTGGIVPFNPIALYIENNGNVGIGTTSPSRTLDVNGDIAVEGVDAIRRDGTNAYIFPWGTGYDNNNVFIGGGAWTNLVVDGDASGASSWGTWSDARLKKNISNYTGGLALIKQLRPVRFQWKEQSERTIGKKLLLDTSQSQIGFIAQEVAAVVPEAVKAPASGSDQPYGLKEANLIPALVAAVQEQEAKIEALQAQFAAYQKAHP